MEDQNRIYNQHEADLARYPYAATQNMWPKEVPGLEEAFKATGKLATWLQRCWQAIECHIVANRNGITLINFRILIVILANIGD